MRKLERRATALAAVLVTTILVSPDPATSGPVRLSVELFGKRLVVEVRGMDDLEADSLIRATLQHVHDLEQAIGETAVARVNAGAGEVQTAAPALLALLTRATAFCGWADGVHGPLGGPLYSLWGLGDSIPESPRGAALRNAVESAACEELGIDPDGLRLDLPAGTALLLRGFALGHAVDTAVEHLQAGGATNGWVELGDVKRGFGAGPDGEGWPVQLPVLGNTADPLRPIFLRNQALAIARKSEPSLRVSGESLAAYLNQVTGHPKTGVLAVAVVTEAAADAEPLSVTMFLLGNSAGEMRLGVLTPTPSVLWTLGGTQAEPLYSYFQWSKLSRPRQR